MNEPRLAIRRLAAHPAATFVSLASLAIAIGAASATWSLLSAVLLHPIDVEAPDRLMIVGTRVERGPQAGTLRGAHIYSVYPHIRTSGIFDTVAAGGGHSLLVGTGDRSSPTLVYFASHDYFEALGIRLPLGRDLGVEDDRRGAPLVAVLSDRYWRTNYATDPAVVGRTLLVAGKPVTIVGVAPRRFRGLDLAQAPALFMPLHSVGEVGSRLVNHFDQPTAVHGSSPSAWLTLVARLRPGMTLDQATSRLNGLDPTATGDGVPMKGRFGLTPVEVAAVPEGARAATTRFASLLAATVGLLLLIGCATVGMLILIRTEARRAEFAMCLAMGATRPRLALGVVVEGALLSVAAAVLAMPLARWLFDGVRMFDLPGGLSIDLLELSIDGRVVAAAGAAAVLATVVIALIAGVAAFPADIARGLRSLAGATPAAGRRRTRSALVAGQVAVAMVLLAGAGLFGRSVSAALSVNPGFDTAHLLTGSVSLGPHGYTPPRASAFFEDLKERLTANPAFRSVSFLERGGATIGKLVVDGEARQFPTPVSFTAIDRDYFTTIGVRVTRGRDFTVDDRPGSTPVAIVSESFGRLLSNGGDPIGRRITLPWHRVGKPADVLIVVGVVRDLITTVAVLEPLVVYSPLAQAERGTSRSLVAHAVGDADAARREASGAIRQIDPAVTPARMTTLDERLATEMAPQRFGMLVMGALGLVAALLTVLGVYVTAESMAVLRRREMGVRAALGARRAQLFAAVLKQSARLVGIGLLGGLTLAWAGARAIRALLFRVQPLDPTTLLAVSAAILLLALAVSLKPAVAAARVDLSRVLRDE